MALIRRGFLLRRGLPANVTSGWEAEGAWRSEWGAPLNIIRESHYQAAYLRVCGPLRPEGYLMPVEAVLIREPLNESDPNAIRVEVGGIQLGYLHRDVAVIVARDMDRFRMRTISLCGVIRGGNEETASFFGLHVWPQQRLSQGPHIVLSRELLVEIPAVQWPPREWEGSEP